MSQEPLIDHVALSKETKLSKFGSLMRISKSMPQQMKLSDILVTMKKEEHHQQQQEEGTEAMDVAPSAPLPVLEIPQISQ